MAERWRHSLTIRLAIAFLLVALAAIVVFATLTVLAASDEATGLSSRHRQDDLAATAIAAAGAYKRAGGWAGADLAPAAAIAARSQASLTVLDAQGQTVAAPTDQLASMMAAMHGVAAVDTPRGEPISAVITVDGDTVGAVMLRFPTETAEAERHVRDALARTALKGTLLAAAVALVAAIWISLRVTRPVIALTQAAQNLAGGHQDTRVDVRGPGEIASLAAAFNEMADQLDRQDQLRRNLVADVAHELRTPLTVLQGSTEALLDGVDEPTPEVLSSLHDEVTRLRQLVSDLEMLAAAEAAGLRMHATPVDLAEVAATTVELLRPLADEREQTLSIETQPSVVLGDRRRLQQVAINLVANAIKYTPRHGTVTVTTTMANSVAVLDVSDSGPGIPPQDLDRVFDRFWRGDLSQDRGSGIGLAVVRELVTAHHGTVTAANQPAGGACFRVMLPAGGQDEQPPKTATTKETSRVASDEAPASVALSREFLEERDL